MITVLVLNSQQSLHLGCMFHLSWMYSTSSEIFLLHQRFSGVLLDEKTNLLIDYLLYGEIYAFPITLSVFAVTFIKPLSNEQLISALVQFYNSLIAHLGLISKSFRIIVHDRAEVVVFDWFPLSDLRYVVSGAYFFSVLQPAQFLKKYICPFYCVFVECEITIPIRPLMLMHKSHWMHSFVLNDGRTSWVL